VVRTDEEETETESEEGAPNRREIKFRKLEGVRPPIKHK